MTRAGSVRVVLLLSCLKGAEPRALRGTATVLLEREPSQAVRAAAGRAFGVLERHFEQRAEQLFSSLSDGVQAELDAALSAESFGTPASGCVRRAAPPSSGRLGPPSSAASSGGMSDCGQFRVPFAPRSGRPSIGEMPGLPSFGSPAP